MGMNRSMGKMGSQAVSAGYIEHSGEEEKRRDEKNHAAGPAESTPETTLRQVVAHTHTHFYEHLDMTYMTCIHKHMGKAMSLCGLGQD